MVVLVLLYGCEIWGHEKLDLIDKLHLKALKYMLHLNRSTLTAQVYGESGIFPISLDIKARIVGFWADLVNPTKPKLASKIYNVLYDLHCRGEYTSPWLLHIKQILTDAGLECVWETQRFTSRNSLCNLVRKNIKTKIETEWKLQLDISSKCLYYKNFKSGIFLEPFFRHLPEQLAIALVKFRCSNHKLPIEQGRRQGIPRDERFCRECDMNVIGDEFHLLMECPAHRENRLKYIPNKFRIIKSTYNFCKLMADKSKTVSSKLAKFLIATKTV